MHFVLLYITLHYVEFRYVPLQYVTLPSAACVDLQNVTVMSQLVSVYVCQSCDFVQSFSNQMGLKCPFDGANLIRTECLHDADLIRSPINPITDGYITQCSLQRLHLPSCFKRRKNNINSKALIKKQKQKKKQR